jgi:hypothetical protein
MATKDKKKDEGFASVLPWLAGGGLVLGGLWLWKSGAFDGGGDGSDTDAQQKKLLVDLSNKRTEMLAYYDEIFANGRTPTDAESVRYGMMVESITTEEQMLLSTYKTEYREATAKYFHDMGLFVIIPVVAGFMLAGGLIAYDRWKRPPRPPTCPKDGVTVVDPEALQAHVEQDHSITTDAAAIAAASAEWNTQPFWVASAVGVVGQTYSTVYNPMFSWNLDALRNNVSGMTYAYAAEMGTVASLAALSRTLIYCLI